jgi:hypothetical protein
VRTAQAGLEHALARCRTRLRLWLRNCLREAMDVREKKHDELVNPKGDWQLDSDMLNYRVRCILFTVTFNANRAHNLTRSP